MIQVTGADVRLLSGTKLLCRIPLDMEGGVRSCDVTDRFAVVLLVSGTVALLELQEQEGDVVATLDLSWPDLAKGSKVKVNLISTYTDYSGLFCSRSGDEMKDQAKKATPPPLVSKTLADEEEELLYGNLSRLVESVKKNQ